MSVEVRVPTLGESVTEATVATWFKKPGDAVAVDEMLCELETDKVTVEVPSPAAGTLGEIVAQEGDTVGVDALLATLGAADGVFFGRGRRDGGDRALVRDHQLPLTVMLDRRSHAVDLDDLVARAGGHEGVAHDARDHGEHRAVADDRHLHHRRPSCIRNSQ